MHRVTSYVSKCYNYITIKVTLTNNQLFIYDLMNQLVINLKVII